MEQSAAELQALEYLLRYYGASSVRIHAVEAREMNVIN